MVNYENIGLLEVVQKVSENPHRTFVKRRENAVQHAHCAYSALFCDVFQTASAHFQRFF